MKKQSLASIFVFALSCLNFLATGIRPAGCSEILWMSYMDSAAKAEGAGDYPKATKLYEAAIAEATQDEDKKQLAQSLVSLASVQSQLGDLATAKTNFQNALGLFVDTNESAEYLNAGVSLADVVMKQNQWQEAELLITRLLSWAEKKSLSRVIQNNLLHKLKTVYQHLGKTAEAEAIESTLAARVQPMNNPKPVVASKNILLVVDCSVQPNGKKDRLGEQNIAKESIASEYILSRIPETAKVGLRVFGNKYSRLDTDCQQSDLLSPLATNNRAKIRELLKELKPTGLSPLTYALMQAENDLRYVEGDKETYLFTAGNDSCSGDPVGYFDRLRKLGVKMPVNVYYFGSFENTGRETSKLIASSSGGKWIDANSDSDLKPLFEKAQIIQGSGKSRSKRSRNYSPFSRMPQNAGSTPVMGVFPRSGRAGLVIPLDNDGSDINFGIGIPDGKIGPYIPLD